MAEKDAGCEPGPRGRATESLINITIGWIVIIYSIKTLPLIEIFGRVPALFACLNMISRCRWCSVCAPSVSEAIAPLISNVSPDASPTIPASTTTLHSAEPAGAASIAFTSLAVLSRTTAAAAVSLLQCVVVSPDAWQPTRCRLVPCLQRGWVQKVTMPCQAPAHTSSERRKAQTGNKSLVASLKRNKNCLLPSLYDIVLKYCIRVDKARARYIYYTLYYIHYPAAPFVCFFSSFITADFTSRPSGKLTPSSSGTWYVLGAPVPAGVAVGRT